MSKLIKLSIIILLSFSSCNNNAVVEETATNFLSAYFKSELSNAAKLCTEDISSLLLESASDLEKIDSTVLNIFKEEIKHINTKILQSTISRDSAVVKYSFTSPTDTITRNNKLKLIKIEGNWKVCAIN